MPASTKREVKKKHISFGRNFSCFLAHLIERDLFWPAAPCARLRGNVTPWFGFSSSGFHRLLATKPVSSETNKAERGFRKKRHVSNYDAEGSVSDREAKEIQEIAA